MSDKVIEEIKGCFSAVPRGIQYAATAVDVDRLSLILERVALEAHIDEHREACGYFDYERRGLLIESAKGLCAKCAGMNKRLAAIRKELGQ